ncbi:GRAM domain-containing protein, partial [Dissophora ornata]
MAVEDYDGFHGVGSFPETTGFDSASASALTSQRNSHETAATGQSEDEYSTQISFVYANEKRSGDFHALFRSVPENEKLIEDYGCALQKEILVQGRIHISENHVCFNANIFGWVTILVIAFSEITAIEKRLTAFVIPNAISIVTTTNTKGHFFASFLSRDAAHDLLMAAWRNTRSSFDEISLALPVNRPRSGTESSPKLRSSPTVVATLSKQTTPSSPPPAAVAVTGAEAAHRTPTTCKDGRHYPSQFMLETYPGSIQSMWKLLFDSEFNKNFLTSEAMKGADVQEEPWQQTADGMSTKATRYTKWIGMPIGPKTTKAILTDVVEHRDLDEYVTTVTTTSTPDVPSGGSFTTKCRTCITWAGPNQVQVEVTGGVEFSKSSWIKGQIEKGAAEGLTTHFKELNKSIRKFI